MTDPSPAPREGNTATWPLLLQGVKLTPSIDTEYRDYYTPSESTESVTSAQYASLDVKELEAFNTMVKAMMSPPSPEEVADVIDMLSVGSNTSKSDTDVVGLVSSDACANESDNCAPATAEESFRTTAQSSITSSSRVVDAPPEPSSASEFTSLHSDRDQLPTPSDDDDPANDARSYPPAPEPLQLLDTSVEFSTPPR